MPANPPVDFEERAKRPKGQTASDYPYAIKGRDLMENFVFATLDVDAGLVEDSTGIGGHKQRFLKIQSGTTANQILNWDGSRYIPLPAPPGDGIYVLGASNGQITWIATEACE